MTGTRFGYTFRSVTSIPTVSTPAEAHAALARCRALVEDRVDPLVGLTLASVQDWITSSHPGIMLEGAADTLGWPTITHPDVQIRNGYANARVHPRHPDVAA